MKIILGDNQFFGINHFDLKRGMETKSKFNSINKIKSFIELSLDKGLDGFMINSNSIGYELVANSKFNKLKEIHYSIPYPHKYASMVNEKGMLSLFYYLIKNTSLSNNIRGGVKFLMSRNLKDLTFLALNLEVPKNLTPGSYIYLQNIVTDMLIGLGRGDVLIEFIDHVISMGYKPGLITMNPIKVDKIIKLYKDQKVINDLIVCFNINKEGFNVFPSLNEVEDFINLDPNYKLMGMSIFSSGASMVPNSIAYVKELKLDYVVFGSSNMDNIENNINLLKSDFL